MRVRSRQTRAAVIFFLGACAFLLLLGRQDVVITHEARVAQTAREMAATGWPWDATGVEVPAVRMVERGGRKLLAADPAAPPLRVNPWVVPVLTGEIRLQKPPLPYWCAATLFRLFGEGSAAARFVPALMGAAATVLLHDLARRLIGRSAGAAAALVWVSSYFVVSEFRKTMADPYLAFFSLACVWAWVRSTGLDGRGGARAGWLLLFYGSLALGLLAKGPVVLVHVAIAAVAYHVCYRRPLPRSLAGHIVGLIVLLGVSIPWPLDVWRSIPHALELWRYESVGELADNQSKNPPFWTYLPKLPYLVLPWTPLWAAGLVYAVARARTGDAASARIRLRRRRLLFPVVWLGATVVFSSFVHVKKEAYLLPVMPAQALLIVQFVHAASAWARLPQRPKWLDTLAWAQTVLVAALGIVVIALLVREATRQPFAGLPLATVALIAAALTAGAAIAPVVYQIRSACGTAPLPLSRWFVAEAVAGAVAVAAFVAVYNAANENRRSPRPFAEAVRRRLAQQGPAGSPVLYRSSLPPTVAFYLPLDTRGVDSARTALVVAGKNGRAADVASRFAAETGQAVAEVRAVPLDDDSNPDRWTLFELTLANPRRYGAGPRSVAGPVTVLLPSGSRAPGGHAGMMRLDGARATGRETRRGAARTMLARDLPWT